MTPPSDRRKYRLIDRKFQLGLAWRLLLVFLLLFFAGIFLVFAPSMTALLWGDSPESLEPAAFEFLVLHKRVWPAVLFVLVGMFAYTILASHRIAGPIYRINSVLRKMLEGNFPDPVAFRKGDHFRETAELLESLSRKLASERAGAPGGADAGRGKDPAGPDGTEPS